MSPTGIVGNELNAKLYLVWFTLFIFTEWRMLLGNNNRYPVSAKTLYLSDIQGLEQSLLICISNTDFPLLNSIHPESLGKLI